jgi:hypothetical protein
LTAEEYEVHAITAGFPGGLRQETVEGITVHRCGNEYIYNLALIRAFTHVSREFQPDQYLGPERRIPLPVLYLGECPAEDHPNSRKSVRGKRVCPLGAAHAFQFGQLFLH